MDFEFAVFFARSALRDRLGASAAESVSFANL